MAKQIPPHLFVPREYSPRECQKCSLSKPEHPSKLEPPKIFSNKTLVVPESKGKSEDKS